MTPFLSGLAVALIVGLVGQVWKMSMTIVALENRVTALTDAVEKLTKTISRRNGAQRRK